MTLKFIAAALLILNYASFASSVFGLFQRPSRQLEMDYAVLRIGSVLVWTVTLWEFWRTTRFYPGCLEALIVAQIFCAVLFWSAARVARRHRFKLAFSLDEPSAVVQEGPYRWWRHPFYTSYLACYFSLALMIQGPQSLLGAGLMLGVYWWAAKLEETAYSRSPAYAAAYREYRKRAWMFWPRSWVLSLLSAGAVALPLVLFSPRLGLVGPRWELTSDVAWSGPARESVAESFILDFNHDGRMDLLLTGLDANRATPLELFENTGLGFKDVTAEKLGEVTGRHVRHLASGDFDGDGQMDFVLADHGFDQPPFPGARPILLMARDGRLYDETSTRLPPLAGFTFHAAVIDADGDKTPDIYLSNIPGQRDPPLLLLNDGLGHFKKVLLDLRHPRTQEPLNMMTAHAADFDADGVPELYIGGQDLPQAKPAQANDLILNFKNGAPEFWPADTLPARARDATWGTASLLSADFDRDGFNDVIAAVHDFGFKHALVQVYRNLGGKGFVSSLPPFTQESGTEGFIPWIEAADTDGDGWLDLLFTFRDIGGKTPAKNKVVFLRGGRGLTFRDESSSLPAGVREGSWLVHLIDMDGDRRAEIVQLGYDRRMRIYKMR